MPSLSGTEQTLVEGFDELMLKNENPVSRRSNLHKPSIWLLPTEECRCAGIVFGVPPRTTYPRSRSMEKDKKKQIATFRFGVIHDLVGHVALEPDEQERLARDKCDRKWVIPISDKTRMP